jgi:hypothetical protein
MDQEQGMRNNPNGLSAFSPSFSPSFDGQKFRGKIYRFRTTHISFGEKTPMKTIRSYLEARVSRQQVQLTSGIWPLRYAAALVLPNAQSLWSISSPDGDFSRTIYPLVI